MKLALAMIVKGVEAEAPMLARCLHYASGAVDEIYITCTHKKGEQVSQKVYDVCNKFKAHTSTFEWINDFAAARNFNFSQVPKDIDYIFWLDADDVLKDSDKNVGLGSNLKETIFSPPDVDAFSMFYLYAFDEHNNATVVHQKTRVVKNDGCCTWKGLGLHEELAANRQLNQFAIKGIEVVHLSNEERLADSRQRNYEIASAWTAKAPHDPTTYFNLANASFGIGKYEDSLQAFDKFLSLSNSDDEKYIARLRRADVLQAKGEIQKALDEARYAIGMKPEYPDAYHAAGKLFYLAGQYEKAKDMFLNGLGRPAPYYQIIVYNPREYDYQPLMNLAKTYYALNLPQLALPALEAAVKIVPADTALKKVIRTLKKESAEGEEIVKLCGKLVKIQDKEKLRKQLDKVPEKFKFHPAIINIRNVNFPKTTSTGKDLVMFCGYTAEEWTPETIAKKGSGGSEEAAITMAQGLADRGWNVTVYNNCGTEETTHGGVIYKPYMSWNYRDKQDVTILWRQTKPLDWDINSTKVYVDMHDVIPAGEFTEARLKKVDKIFFKSAYHRNLYPAVPEEKTLVIPNGIHPEKFPADNVIDEKLVINTSSPVRALSALIDIMKMVRKEVPDAKMQWAYGWTTTDSGLAGSPLYPEWKTNILKGMEEAGIEDLGRLNHEDVAKLYSKAAMYVYPTGFPEIDCISITKALAAGAFPVTTDYGAIKEKAGHGGDFIHYEDSLEKFGQIDYAIESQEVKELFAQKIIEHLKKPIDADTRKSMRQFALENYSWQSIIDKWNDILNYV